MRLFFFGLIILFPFCSVCQKNDPFIVLDTPMNFIKPDKFYISEVVDSRMDKSLNNLRVTIKANQKNDNDSLSLRKTLLLLFNNYLPKDTALVPVIIDIKDFSIVPRVNTGFPKDELKIELRYQVFLDGKNAEFASYSYNQGLYKYMKTTRYLSKLLQDELPDIVKELNRFINNSFGSFPYKGMKVHTSFTKDISTSPDTLFYNTNARLSWNNFKGKPDSASEASATTGSGFTCVTNAEIKNGYMDVSVIIKCFFLTQSSWVKPEQASENVLEHERLHFDINYLGALRFADSIAKAHFTVGGWQSELENLNEIKFRETSILQAAYDHESSYGRRGRMQLVWQKKIQALIKENLP